MVKEIAAYHEKLEPERQEVARVFENYPPVIRNRLFALRQLILEIAEETEGVGPVQEALRWGEPSYLTPVTKSGSTVRLGSVRGAEDRYALYFHCGTTLVETFRQMYPDVFSFSGNRAIEFHVDDVIPDDELRHCVALALRYHLDKKRNER